MPKVSKIAFLSFASHPLSWFEDGEMKKTLFFLFILVMVTSAAHAGRKKPYNIKTGLVQVKFIGNNSFNINSQVIHSTKPAEPIKSDSQNVSVVPEVQNVQTCNVKFDIQTEGSCSIKEVFETDNGISEERIIQVSENKEKVSLNFVDPKKKNIKKVIYTIYSL